MSDLGSEVEHGALRSVALDLAVLGEQLDELLLECLGIGLAVLLELFEVQRIQRCHVAGHFLDEFLSHVAAGSLVDAEDALLSVVGRNGKALIINFHLLQLFFDDFGLHHLAIVVLVRLWDLLGDSDSNDGLDRVIWRLLRGALNWVLALLDGWWVLCGNTGHLVGLELDPLDPRLHLLWRNLNQVSECVQVPEALEGQVENTGFNAEVVLAVAHHVEHVTTGFLTDKLAQVRVVGLLHSPHVVELEGDLQVAEEVLELGVNLDRQEVRLQLLVDVVVDETLDDLGREDLVGVLLWGQTCLRLFFVEVLLTGLGLGATRRLLLPAGGAGLNGHVEALVVLGNGVEHHDQLADETTDNRHNGGVLAAEAVNVHNILEDDALLGLGLLNELLVDLLLQVSKLLGAFGSLSVLAALDLGLDALLLLLLGLLCGVVALLVVLGDGGLVGGGDVVDEGVHHVGL